ncbi:MAG: MBL fold metallo-hydrolase [Chloroflexi bacterium]|nr:MAG: ribonuclease Z [Chloroflexi bacterium OLB13]MCC6567384.1 MBL fold metallo-hydrolase [Chloroflexota bacterium]
MFELVFLGTSASAPSIHRGLPSLAVLAGEHRYLVDCGEGTQRQILRSGIGFKRLNRILLTHAHLDHILGLGGLISTFANFESVDFIEIYGGKPALDRVDTLLFSVVLREERNPMPISLVDIHRASRVLDARTHEVYAFPVQHRGPGCFGFEFREHAHRPFLAERAAELGVPTGPERGMLVRGESVVLADGRAIAPGDVLGPEVAGAKVVVMADVGRTDTLVEQCRDADALVIEATFLDEHADEARAFGHITARQAAELAVASGVRSLILWHVSRRYRERDIVAEARSVFPEAIVARDFDHFTIKRGEGATRLAPVLAHEDESQ